jgi:hypothetical protein
MHSLLIVRLVLDDKSAIKASDDRRSHRTKSLLIVVARSANERYNSVIVVFDFSGENLCETAARQN